MAVIWETLHHLLYFWLIKQWLDYLDRTRLRALLDEKLTADMETLRADLKRILLDRAGSTDCLAQKTPMKRHAVAFEPKVC